MMLHGRTKPSRVNQKQRAEDESIKANMIQYNLQHLYLDIFVADFSNCPLSDAFQLDAIITDRKFPEISTIKQQILFRENRSFYSKR
jgi:tRNA (guanine10-N2)-methyltransferase